MAADPGCSSVAGGPYHLFLTRIPPKLPKEEVEAALSAELASRRVSVLAISVVPQSAWKNKGFGFVVLEGSPSPAQVDKIAAELDNSVRIGGKAINVRVCQASVSGGKPAVNAGPLSSWDQPAEKITRLCAQVLHCYFARRTHQETYKVERLLALLSMSVAPSCCQEPKPVSLWGRDVYGTLEKMLLAIGDSHFGGGWSLEGTIADRNAVLSIGKARHMQGWDALRDPLPIATLLRLAACKQRLEGIHTPDVGSGFSTPTVCRRCSDCGSLSAMHSTEQPSCSQSEASWSLRGSLYAGPATATGDNTSSDCSTSVCTPSNDTEGTALSSVTSTTPGSWTSCKSLGSGSGSGSGCSSGSGGGGGPVAAAAQTTLESGSAASSEQQQHLLQQQNLNHHHVHHPDQGHSGPQGPAAAVKPSAGLQPQRPGAHWWPAGSGTETSAGTSAPSEGAGDTAAAAAASTSGRSPSGRMGGTGCSTSRGSRGSRGRPGHSGGSSSCGSSVKSLALPGAHRASHLAQAPQPAAAASGPPPHLRTTVEAGSCPSSSWVENAPQPPSAKDLLKRCSKHLRTLFQHQPAQISYAVADVALYLSQAQEVVAWGRDAPYFSLEGYARAVYGSFERFLLEISRLHFNNSWYFAGGQQAGEPRVMLRNRRLAAAGGLLPTL